MGSKTRMAATAAVLKINLCWSHCKTIFKSVAGDKIVKDKDLELIDPLL